MSNEVFDHLARIAQGKPTADQERRQSAVDTLVSLTRNLPTEQDHDQAAIELAELISRTER